LHPIILLLRNGCKPDYSNLDYWAAHPWKWDPSDSVPLPFVKIITGIQVWMYFLSIQPPIPTRQNLSAGTHPVDNADINAKTDYSTILFQASIFNEAGRVFSPRYRQANYFSYLPITAEDTAHAIAAFDLRMKM
jgi:hypothetical protein